MNPDYETAAVKAIQTLMDYKISPTNIDPLLVLNSLKNVRLISYGIYNEEEMQRCLEESPFVGSNQVAFTLVNRKGSQLQYIVIYNQNESPITLRSALARELGHVILQHDGSSPEEIWMEEANCFAYHFLCPITLLDTLGKNTSHAINFRPIRDNLHWELKEMRIFESMDEMKSYVVDERNKFNRAIGHGNIQYRPRDVLLEKSHEYDTITGWKNCFDIVLDGRTVGHCGE